MAISKKRPACYFAHFSENYYAGTVVSPLLILPYYMACPTVVNKLLVNILFVHNKRVHKNYNG